MAVNLIRKLLTEAVQTGGTYAEFIVAEDKVTFICDGGSRKSTRNYRQSKADIKEDEKVLKTISEKNLLFSVKDEYLYTIRGATLIHENDFVLLQDTYISPTTNVSLTSRILEKLVSFSPCPQRPI